MDNTGRMFLCLIAGIIGVSMVVVGGIVALEVMRPTDDHSMVITVLLGFAGTIIPGLFAALNSIRNSSKLEEVKKDTKEVKRDLADNTAKTDELEKSVKVMADIAEEGSKLAPTKRG